MMYEEFCDGVGMKIDHKCYERIEAVYMAFDRFTSKEAIYGFYKKHDMNGIETLYSALHGFAKLSEQQARLQDEIAERQKELNGIIGELNRTAMLYGIRLGKRYDYSDYARTD